MDSKVNRAFGATVGWQKSYYLDLINLLVNEIDPVWYGRFG